MPSCLEFEGKVVEKAVEKASEALNIPKDKLQYSVVSYGSSGIFGLVGAKKAKICVTLPDKAKRSLSRQPRKEPTSPPKKRRYLDDETSKSISDIVEEAFELATPTSKPESSESPESSTPASDFKQNLLESEAVQFGREALQLIVDQITTEAAVTVTNGDDRILFNIDGGNTGVIIGKRGQTLEAIQYLVEKIVNRHSDERIRIQVDVEGYLENRKASLKSLAKRLAEKAKTTGKPSTVGQMNAHDRRIVHITLKNDSGVRTQSVGDGFYRKLVIFPNKKRRKKNA